MTVSPYCFNARSHLRSPYAYDVLLQHPFTCSSGGLPIRTFCLLLIDKTFHSGFRGDVLDALHIFSHVLVDFMAPQIVIESPHSTIHHPIFQLLIFVSKVSSRSAIRSFAFTLKCCTCDVAEWLSKCSLLCHIS